MEIYLNRQQIRQQMRALLGQTTNEATGGQTLDMFNAYIDRAQMKAIGDQVWLVDEIRVTVDLGQEQYKLAYPADMAVGSVKEIGVYDETSQSYTMLIRQDLGVNLDFDQLEALGGDDFDAIQDEPQWWQQRGDYIYLYPPNDSTPRKIRIRGARRKTFANDQQQSSVDAEAIIYWATALAWAGMKDEEQATRYQGLYVDRIGALRANQNSGRSLPVDETADFDEDAMRYAPGPRWDTRPRVP